MIKMIAIDLDDTLLDHDLRIPDMNKKTIRQAEEQGITVILASGRAPQAMKKYAEELGMIGRDEYLIADNGASLMSTEAWTILHQFPVDISIAQKAWDIVSEAGFPMQYYENGTIFRSGSFNTYTNLDTKLTGQPAVAVDDFKSALKQSRVKFVIPGDPEALPPLQDCLREELGSRANIFISKPYFLEILNPEADKGHALEYIAGEKGISPDEIMAIGDSMNDLGMLRYAGTPVAMANAREEIKKAASYTTKADNENGGVAEAIRIHCELPDPVS